MTLRFALAFAVSLCAIGAATAREQIPAEERVYSYDAAKVPGCDDAVAVTQLRNRFREKESEYWGSNLEIVEVTQIRTTHFRANGLDFIPRRYCRGTAVLNNRRTSPVYYVLTQEAGMAGNNFGIQFCVAAYDRGWSYTPECKMAKP